MIVIALEYYEYHDCDRTLLIPPLTGLSDIVANHTQEKAASIASGNRTELSSWVALTCNHVAHQDTYNDRKQTGILVQAVLNIRERG